MTELHSGPNQDRRTLFRRYRRTLGSIVLTAAVLLTVPPCGSSNRFFSGRLCAQEVSDGGTADAATAAGGESSLAADSLATPMGPESDQPVAGDGFSVLNRLSGFDRQRLTDSAAWLRQPQDAERLAEVAKLLFQVNRLAGSSLRRTAVDGDGSEFHPPRRDAEIGDAVHIRGRVVAVAGAKLPVELADLLEFPAVYRVEVRTDAGDDAAASSTVYVLTSNVPSAWLSAAGASSSAKLDQPTAATGVLIAAGRPTVLAAPGLAWYPTAESVASADWALLARHGFDAALIESIRVRDRKSLSAADRESFYALLRSAARVEARERPAPRDIDAGQLLKESARWIGHRLRIDCQSVRLTRVAVSDPAMRQRLDTDHYWQIDASGDLGDLMIRIEPADGESEPATFVNRYPISIVALSLPESLRRRLESDGVADTRSDVALVSRRLVVEGFLYRLWSYESDLMRRHGGGDQFGPLIMASRIIDDEPTAADPAGVALIGRVAAVAAMIMLVAAAGWVYRTGRQDAAAQARRQNRPERLDWSDE